MPRLARLRACTGGQRAQRRSMMHDNELAPVPSDHPVAHADRLRLAAAAYLARFKGTSRDHADSGLRCYLTWRAGRGLDPFPARRPHLELYIRWMQEVRRFKPSTVSRRFSVVAGFYRTCVIDGGLEHSPAGHVRRPAVPAESPAPGFTHLQFEALLTAARESASRNDFALVAMPGLLGLRILEAASADIGGLGEEHGHRVLRVRGKGGRVVLVPLPPSAGRAAGRPSAPAWPARSCATPAAHAWTGTPPPGGSGGSPRRRASGSPGRTRTCSGIRLSRPMPGAGVDLRDVQIAARHAGPRTIMRQSGPARTPAATPSCILAACVASGTWPGLCLHRYEPPGSPALPMSGHCWMSWRAVARACGGST